MRNFKDYIQEHLDHGEFLWHESHENSFLTFEEYVNKSNLILTNKNIYRLWDKYEQEKYEKFIGQFVISENVSYTNYAEYQKYIYSYIYENLNKFIDIINLIYIFIKIYIFYLIKYYYLYK